MNYTRVVLCFFASLSPLAVLAQTPADLAKCACYNELAYFPNGANAHPGIGFTQFVYSIALEGPTTVCVGQWFQVKAILGADSDLKKGPGQYCFTPLGECSGTPLPDCPVGQVKGHLTSNINQKYIWEVVGEQEFRLPEADEEIDRPECPHFNYDTDPFIWIKAPNGIAATTITVTCSRAPDTTFNDGNVPSATATIQVNPNLSARTRSVGYTMPTAPSAFSINMTFFGASYLFYTETDNDVSGGPARQYDSNGNFAINPADSWRGRFDMGQCIRYFSGNVTALSNTSQLAGQSVIDDSSGAAVTINPSDYVNDFDSWWDFRPSNSVTMVSALYVDVGVTNGIRHVRRLGGLGTCGANMRVIIGFPLINLHETLAHEWGHNADFSHVDIASTQTEYQQNIMSYSHGMRAWLSGEPLVVDATISCGRAAPVTQVQIPSSLL